MQARSRRGHEQDDEKARVERRACKERGGRLGWTVSAWAWRVWREGAGRRKNAAIQVCRCEGTGARNNLVSKVGSGAKAGSLDGGGGRAFQPASRARRRGARLRIAQHAHPRPIRPRQNRAHPISLG
jgi:hypothetical protein